MEHDESIQPQTNDDTPQLTAQLPSNMLSKMLTPLGLDQVDGPSLPANMLNRIRANWQNQEWSKRVAVLQSLNTLSEHVHIQFVVQALQDENEHVRAAAARALGRMSDRSPVQPLVSVLNDPSWSVRAAAAQALGKIGWRAPVDPLVEVMRSDEDEAVRASAAHALGRMGEQVPLQPLLLALQDKAWLVREAAASALGGSGQRVPVEALLAALRDPDASVRQAVQATLQQTYLDNPLAANAISRPAESDRKNQFQDSDQNEIRYVPLRELPTRPPVRFLPAGSHPLVRMAGIGATVLAVASIILASLILFRPRATTVVGTGSQNGPCSQSTNVSPGCVFFKNSEDVNRAGKNNGIGINDILEIDLSSVPEPAAGKSYYAWLLGSSTNPEGAALLLDRLTIDHGHIHYVYQDPHRTDLLAATSAFLITEEDASVQPISPSPDRTVWRYYSELPQRPDPADTANHYSVLDHLHHLLTADPNLEPLGLHGGLGIWLTRNTQGIMQFAQRAQDASGQKDAQGIRKQLIGILDYLDGSTYVQTDVPPGTPLQIDSSVARVAVLTFDELNQEPPGYDDHIVYHLRAIAANPYTTPYQKELAIRLTATMNTIDAQFRQLHENVKNLVDMSNSQLLQPTTKAKLASLVAQTTLLYHGRADTAKQQVQQEGVVQVYQAMQSLATFEVQLYK